MLLHSLLLVTPGYDRYFVQSSKDSTAVVAAGLSVPDSFSWTDPVTLDEAISWMDVSLVFQGKGHLARAMDRLAIYRCAFASMREEQRLSRTSDIARLFKLRRSSIHRSRCWIHGSCHIDVRWLGAELSIDSFLEAVPLIVRRTALQARFADGLTPAHLLPIGFVRFHFYDSPMLVRDTEGYGLRERYIGMIDVKRDSVVKSPTIWGGIPLRCGSSIFYFNKNWRRLGGLLNAG